MSSTVGRSGLTLKQWLVFLLIMLAVIAALFIFVEPDPCDTDREKLDYEVCELVWRRMELRGETTMSLGEAKAWCKAQYCE